MRISALLASLSLTATASAACSREMLKSATSAYVAAQMAGQSNLSSLAEGVSYYENNKTLDVKTGVLSQPLKIDHNRSIHDTVDCTTFTELIAASNPHPYVIGTRMLLADDGKVTKMESIVTDAGDWAFNATGYLYWNSIETSWDPIPEGKRDSRAVIKAAGDAYFDRWNNVSVVIPMGTPCARLEGGAYTGRGNLSANTCDIGGFPSTIKVTDRKYVVDEEMGVVDIFMGFPGLDRANALVPMPDSHMFRVEGGLIRYIHTVSACWADGCGMGNAGIPSR
jgi:hypothetical protein